MALPLPYDLDDERGGLAARHRHLPLWCEASYGPERGLTLEQAVERHVNLYGFEQNFTKGLQEDRFEHETSHMLLSLAFRKLGFSPIEYDFPVNGNFQSEALTLAIESFIKPHELAIPKNMLRPHPPSAYTFQGHYQRYYKSYGHKDSHTLARAVEQISHSPITISLFESRQADHFDLGAMGPDMASLPAQTSFGEPLPVLCPLPTATVNAIYKILEPALDLIQAKASRMFTEEASASLSPAERESRIRDMLRQLPMDSLWQSISAAPAPARDVAAFTHTHRRMFVALERLYAAAGCPLDTPDVRWEASNALETVLSRDGRPMAEMERLFSSTPETFEAGLQEFRQAFEAAANEPVGPVMQEVVRSRLSRRLMHLGCTEFLQELDDMTKQLNAMASEGKRPLPEAFAALQRSWRHASHRSVGGRAPERGA